MFRRGTARAVMLVGCGRIAFDPIGEAGVLIDGITVSAPCDVPTQIGQSSFATPLGAPVIAATGAEPTIGSSGSHFCLIYRPASAAASFSLVTLTSALVIERDVPLHANGTAIDQATVASGDGEAIAVWRESGTGEIWMRRLCGP